MYLGISPSKFDELRKANRIAPPKVLDGRLIFAVERLDEFLDALPDENQDARTKTGRPPYERFSLPSMPRRLPPGCVEDRDRHGNIRIYYRAKGSPQGPPSRHAMDAGIHGRIRRGQRDRIPESKACRATGASGTWRWLCVHYFAECADYKRLDARTQHVRRQILEAPLTNRLRPKSDRFFRDFPLAKMNANAVEVLRDRKLSTPEAANGRVKAMRQVFKWGVAKGHAPFNPAREVAYFKSGSEGFHTWTPEEVQQFEERHPIGTKARLALALLLYTGQRRSDISGSASSTLAAAS